MKVIDFQELSRGIAKAIAGDSAKAAKELEKLVDGLDPFKTWTITELINFLAKAEEYSRTGVISAKSSKRQSTKADAVVVSTTLAKLNELFDKAIEPSTTYSTIEEEIKAIDKTLKKPDVIEVARQFGIKEAIKSKKEALEKIENRIARRKEGHDHMSSVRDM